MQDYTKCKIVDLDTEYDGSVLLCLDNHETVMTNMLCHDYSTLLNLKKVFIGATYVVDTKTIVL